MFCAIDLGGLGPLRALASGFALPFEAGALLWRRRELWALASVPVLFSLKLAQTVYDVPAVDVMSSAVFTNTPPTVPSRGAGRPEAVYIMERLIDTAAHEMGHALGILMHSDNPRDVMYPTNTATSLSARDYRTMEALYELADGTTIVR